MLSYFLRLFEVMLHFYISILLISSTTLKTADPVLIGKEVFTKLFILPLKEV